MPLNATLHTCQCKHARLLPWGWHAPFVTCTGLSSLSHLQMWYTVGEPSRVGPASPAAQEGPGKLEDGAGSVHQGFPSMLSQHALEPTWEQPAGSATGQRRSALGILLGSLPQLAMCSPPFLDSKFRLSTQCLGIALCAKRALAAHSPTMCSQP